MVFTISEIISMSAQPPVAKGEFLYGVMREFSNDTPAFMLRALPMGNVVKFYFGPFPGYIINHPDQIHQVLVQDADKYYKHFSIKRSVGAVAGNGIFTSDGEFWKRQRKLAQPAFHTKRIGSYANVMVEYAERTANAWHDGEKLDVDRQMAHLTMEIISKTLFDADVKDDVSQVGPAMESVFLITNDRLNDLFPLPYWVPTPRNRRFAAEMDRLNATIQRFVDDRRKSGEDKGDLLSMLLMAQDDDGAVMTDQQVRDEALTLFGAGHETTAVTMSWTWFLLAQYPQIEARLHAELDEVLGGRAPTFDDLPRLRYTEMIIKEALRLYPPAFGVSREPIVDTKIGDYDIPKSSVVFINIFGVQRDPNIFPEPERFDPERFSSENEKRIPKYAYIPFGGGPRICIGNAFAMMEAKLLLATLAQHWRFTPVAGHIVKPVRAFTLRPQGGLKMIAHRRTPPPTTTMPLTPQLTRA
jgi:cytochrome P450